MSSLEQGIGTAALREPKRNDEIKRRAFLAGVGKLAGGSLFAGALGFLTANNPEVNLGEPIMMSDYFIKKRSEGLIGEKHRMSQVVEENMVYIVKHEPKAYEQYERMPNGDFYLRLDHSNPKKPYTFSNGLFIPHEMRVGERKQIRNNIVQWYDQYANTVSENSGRFNYDIQLMERNPAYDIGGDLGMQDILRLRYDYFTDYEEFLYSNEWGQVGWRLYDKGGQMKDEAIFNSIADKNLAPAKWKGPAN